MNLVQLLKIQGDIMEWQDLTMAQKKYLIQVFIKDNWQAKLRKHKNKHTNDREGHNTFENTPNPKKHNYTNTKMKYS